jgi:hypothetical protein
LMEGTSETRIPAGIASLLQFPPAYAAVFRDVDTDGFACRLRVKCLVMTKTRCFHQQPGNNFFSFRRFCINSSAPPTDALIYGTIRTRTKTCPFPLYEE